MRSETLWNFALQHHLPRTLFLILASGTIAKPALGQDATLAKPADATVVSEPLALIPMMIEKAQIQLSVPQSWETTSELGGLTLKTQEPELTKPVYGKPVFRRSLTLSVAYGEGSPIDETRANELRKTIEDQFKPQYPDFSTNEHKILTMQNENDAILVYSRYTANVDKLQVPMIVMHVLRANEDKQYLFTYADMEERFSSSAEFNVVYGMIQNATIAGKPLVRYQREVFFGGGLLVLILSLLGLSHIRSRNAQKLYETTADEIYGLSASSKTSGSLSSHGSVHTQSLVWALDGKAQGRRALPVQKEPKAKSLVESNFFSAM
jgi:hypothetical protein